MGGIIVLLCDGYPSWDEYPQERYHSPDHGHMKLVDHPGAERSPSGSEAGMGRTIATALAQSSLL